MLKARERMNIIAAYREVGTYRGAAVVCHTTAKTVKRVVQREEAGGVRLARKPQGVDQGTRRSESAPEGIRTPNLLIRRRPATDPPVPDTGRDGG
jgi:hypothetical protein